MKYLIIIVFLLTSCLSEKTEEPKASKALSRGIDTEGNIRRNVINEKAQALIAEQYPVIYSDDSVSVTSNKDLSVSFDRMVYNIDIQQSKEPPAIIASFVVETEGSSYLSTIKRYLSIKKIDKIRTDNDYFLSNYPSDNILNSNDFVKICFNNSDIHRKIFINICRIDGDDYNFNATMDDIRVIYLKDDGHDSEKGLLYFGVKNTVSEVKNSTFLTTIYYIN